MTATFAAMLVEVGLITYRASKRGASAAASIARLPVPAEYAGAVIVFGTLGLFSGRAAVPAAAFAWGLVIATALNTFSSSTIVSTSFVPGLGFVTQPVLTDTSSTSTGE